MKLFHPGDIVQMPGGPLMTVKAMEDGQVKCGWFQRGIQHEGLFEPSTLSLRGLLAVSDETTEPQR